MNWTPITFVHTHNLKLLLINQYWTFWVSQMLVFFLLALLFGAALLFGTGEYLIDYLSKINILGDFRRPDVFFFLISPRQTLICEQALELYWGRPTWGPLILILIWLSRMASSGVSSTVDAINEIRGTPRESFTISIRALSFSLILCLA